MPVPVDTDGLEVAKALRACPQPRAVYVTPAHQFPLGMTMSLERRLALLAAARRSGARVIEDDYDSEFRFSGRPVPALRGLDRSGAVILAGSFNKVLFPLVATWLPGAAAIPHGSFSRVPLSGRCLPSGTP